MENGVWTGQSLYNFCSDAHNVELLRTLQSKGAICIRTKPEIGTFEESPYAVFPEDGAGEIWYENSEKWKNRILGFIAGVLTTVIAQWFIVKLIE